MKVERFEDLECWQLGRKICIAVHDLSLNPKLKGDYPLRDQMSRSSGSIMDNIAEGYDAGSNAEFIRFLWYAKRSATELQSQLYRALDRACCTTDEFDSLYELARLSKAKIASLIKYLGTTLARPSPRRVRLPNPEPRTPKP